MEGYSMMQVQKNHAGKAAVITGATRGIGKAVSLRLAGLGVHICAIARKQDELDELRKGIEAFGVQCVTCIANVSDFAALGEAMQQAYDRFHRIDILLNNAGTGVACPFEELTLEDIDETIDVNLKGVIYGTKLALPFMAKTGGNIINVSSMSATRGIPDPVNNNGIYTATKFGVNGFSECMEKYLLKYNIHVTTFCPGSTATSWWERWTHSFGRDRMIPTEYIADIVELILNCPDHVLFKQLRILPDAEADNF